jgi:hypothetical protein
VIVVAIIVDPRCSACAMLIVVEVKQSMHRALIDNEGWLAVHRRLVGAEAIACADVSEANAPFAKPRDRLRSARAILGL